MNNYCENFKAIITATDTRTNTKLVSRTRCKQWTCQYCAKINKRVWQARILEHINSHTELSWSWFTLTAHSKKRSSSQSLANLRAAWDVLMKRIKRHFKDVKKIHYLRVYEQHKNGAYHLHCIISVHWDDLKVRVSVDKDGNETQTSHSTWLDKQCRDLKIGYYSHADNFRGKHAGYIAGYVTKYMTKMSFIMKKELGRVRHIQPSQGWTKFEDEAKYKWKMESGIYEKDIIHAIRTGQKILDLNTGEYITIDNLIDYAVYPNEFSAYHEVDSLTEH